jgi:transposase
MMRVDRTAKVYLAVGATDLRKAINGLAILAQQQMGQDPFGGGYFAFSNRARNRIKVLYWDRNGFCLWQKRLERDRFRWPKNAAEVMELDGRQLEWLLAGLDVREAHAEVKYSRVI